MAREYPVIAIPDHEVPRATAPGLQHALDTYASEINKVAAIWLSFDDADLDYRPHARSSRVGDILKHQLLSERRFFGEFLGLAEPPATAVVPEPVTIAACAARLTDLARPRLAALAVQPDSWWLTRTAFFDVERERAWIFWRRVLHTAHHRTQLTVYLRMLGRRVPATYGPTADETWEGADPTSSVAAAGRR
jgi:uncharacterized damage-inducible protein DinB